MENLKYRYIDGKVESIEFVSETEFYFKTNHGTILKKETSDWVWRDTRKEAIDDGIDEERIAIKVATARVTKLLFEKDFFFDQHPR